MLDLLFDLLLDLLLDLLFGLLGSCFPGQVGKLYYENSVFELAARTSCDTTFGAKNLVIFVRKLAKG